MASTDVDIFNIFFKFFFLFCLSIFFLPVVDTSALAGHCSPLAEREGEEKKSKKLLKISTSTLAMSHGTIAFALAIFGLNLPNILN